jgi:hypothetical protein
MARLQSPSICLRRGAFHDDNQFQLLLGQRGEFVRFTGGAKKAGAFSGNREAGLNDFLDAAATIPTPFTKGINVLVLVVNLEVFSGSAAAAA